MFLEESLWIKNKLQSLDLSDIDTILDIGSSSLHYRTVEQPYIEKNVFFPLKQKGCKVIHLDCKKEDGVDIVCNIKNLSKLKQEYRVILCTNLLEHTEDRNKVIEDIIGLVKKGGYVLATVPYDFVYHKDPVDTMFRPSNKELEEAFSNFDMSVIASEIIEAPSAIYHLNRLKAIYDIFMKKAYHVSCLLTQKKDY